MSKFAQKVKRYYDDGVWTERMVRDAYAKGRITAEELTEILGEGEPDKAAIIAALGSNSTKAELQAACDALGISYSPSDTKAELMALIEAV